MQNETDKLKEDLLQYANAFYDLISDKTATDLIESGYTDSEVTFLMELKVRAAEIIKNNTL